MAQEYEPDALELIEEAKAMPTLDAFLDRYPAKLTPEDYMALLKRLRHERALYIKAEEDRKAKRGAG